MATVAACSPGDAECFGGGDGCVRTIAEVFSTMNGAAGGTTTVAKGVDLDSQDQRYHVRPNQSAERGLISSFGL